MGHMETVLDLRDFVSLLEPRREIMSSKLQMAEHVH